MHKGLFLTSKTSNSALPVFRPDWRPCFLSSRACYFDYFLKRTSSRWLEQFCLLFLKYSILDDQGLNSLWSHYISNLSYQKYAANIQNGIKAPCGTCWLLTNCCYLIFYSNWILFIWLGGNLKPLFWGLPQNRLFALTCFWYLHVVCASQKFCCLTIIINILLYVWNIS